MNLSPKFITVLALLQCFFVVAGTIATTACFKSIDLMMQRSFLYLSLPLPIFVRTYGWWFLLVPMAWGFFAATSGKAVRGIAFIPSWLVALGVVLAVAIAVFFMINAFQAMWMAFGPWMGLLKAA